MSIFLYKGDRNSTKGGFTLLEVLATVIIAGILAAIAAPAWLGTLSRQRVNAARSLAFSKFGATQSLAQTNRQGMILSFRVSPTDGALEYAIHTVEGTDFNNPDSFGLNCRFAFAAGQGATRARGCETWTPLLPDRARAAQLNLLLTDNNTLAGRSVNEITTSNGIRRITCIRFNPDGTINSNTVDGTGKCFGTQNKYFVFANSTQTQISCFRLGSKIGQVTLFGEGESQGCSVSDKVRL